MAETKPRSADSLRTPKPKKKLGLAVPPALRLPHEDLIIAAPEKIIDPTGQTSMPSQTSLTRHSSEISEPISLGQTELIDAMTIPSQTSLTSLTRYTKSEKPIAPIRDFTKVANSIHREAVPSGLFTGKGKQLYDCLYSLSRGAIVPSRTVRISRPKLMKLAGIGARVTFEANIERLAAVGLLQVRRIAGEHDGNEYTVLLPEELSQTSQTSLTSLTSHAQNLVRLDGLDSSQTRHTLTVEEKDTSGESKTSFNTKEENPDDEAFAGFVARVKKVASEITGKQPSPAEADRWAEVAEVLMTELQLAAGRTTISSVPAFLAEHLRRRLWKKEKRQIEAEAAEQKESVPAKKIDATICPDCFGTGMWYPGGYENGVARCSHSKLTAGEGHVG